MFLKAIHRLPLSLQRSLVFGLLGALVALGVAGQAAAQDTDPPVLRVLNGGVEMQGGEVFAGPVTLVLEATDASTPVTITATLDGTAFTSGDTVSGEGAHALQFDATDAAGNAATLSRSFEIDTVPPTLGEVTPTVGTVTAASEVTLSGTVTDAVAVTVNGQGATLNGGAWSAGPFSLAEGDNVFVLQATDAAGNVAARDHRVERDTVAPTVSIAQPSSMAVLGASSVDVVGSATDPHLATVTVNGIAAVLSGSSFVARQVPLVEGSNTLSAVAMDAAGNPASAVRTVMRDTVPPVLAITDPAAGTVVPLGEIEVSGTVDEANLARVEVTGATGGPVTATILPGGGTSATWRAMVALSEGANTLTVVALDAVGHSVTDSVSVLRDSQAPAIHIDQPADGARLSVPAVEVSGTVEEEPSLSVTVNGDPAALAGGAFSAPAVPLNEGENRLIARVTDGLGNQGAHTLLVTRDTTAPAVLAVDPPAGALAVPPTARFEVTISEPLAEPAVGAWRLERADGMSLAATASLAGDRLVVLPDALLPSGAALRLVLTSALTDLAGNALADPPIFGFTVADVEAPAAPSLNATPTPICASAITLSGSTESEARLRVNGGAGQAVGQAAADGTFQISVELAPERLQRLEVVATDRDGNESLPATVEVVHDCRGPEVVSAEQTGDAFTLEYSEPVAAATLSGAVTVTGASGAVAGSVSSTGGGWQAVFSASSALPTEPLQLAVSTAVADLAGNPLVYPFSTLFGGAVTTSFVAGRVIDDATGRPLPGARVEVTMTDGTANVAPVPEGQAAGDGRFSIPVAPGNHRLVVSRDGYVPALRQAVAAGGVGVDVFDPRLTPAAGAQVLAASGGEVTFAGGVRLSTPGGVLPQDASVAATALSEQALPAPLPWGWSPRGGAWLELDSAPSVDLFLPVDSPDGVTLVVARLEESSLLWRVEAEVTVTEGAIRLPVSAVSRAWVVVEADSGATAPPTATVGSPLAASAAPDPAALVSAAASFSPPRVLPAQTSDATVTYSVSSDVPSGLRLVLSVREELTLLDGSVRREVPYEADLVVFRSPAGDLRSRFRLAPSNQARSVLLEEGAEDVALRPHGGGPLEGGVVGSAGGVVTTPEGDRVELPAGALAGPVPVALERLAEGDLPLALSAAVTFEGALTLDLSGRTLSAPAALVFELGAAPASGTKGLLLTVAPGSGGTDTWRPVAELVATVSGWSTAVVDPADLPWPAVREEGIYVFVRRVDPLGFLRGTVSDETAALLAGARVRRVDGAAPWIQLANADGTYALPVALGSRSLEAMDPATLDRGLGSATVATEDERVDLNLVVAATGPQVVTTDPAAGEVDVLPGIEPVVVFSEPVDPASVAAGIRLYDGAALVPTDHQVSGATVRLIPRATLRPGVLHELRLNSALQDYSGRRLASPVTVSFSTRQVSVADGLDATRIHLFEPVAPFDASGAGAARVLGRPGAVPAGALVFAENVSRLATVPSVTAPADGSFELWIDASLTDTLLLHVLPNGENESIFELGPFLSADGRSARLAATEARSFTTLDGVTVTVEQGTFDTPATVRLEPAAVSEVPAPKPADFTFETTFRLSVEGAEARKALGLSLPVPTGAVGDEFLLARVERILGEDFWMVHDLMRRDGNRLTNQPPLDQAAAAAGLLAAPVAITQLASLAPPQGPQPFSAPARMGDRQEYLPGSANPGLYVVMSYTSQLDFVGLPLPGLSGAYFRHLAIEGMVAVVNASITRLLERDAILMPTRRGETVSLEGRALDTGYLFFEGVFDPPAPGDIGLPPVGGWGDSEAPRPVGGSPLRFVELRATTGGGGDLTPGLSWSFDNGQLEVIGAAQAVVGGAAIRLLGLEDGVQGSGEADADGAFTLTASATAGRRYLLALGAEVLPSAPLTLQLSEVVEADAADLTVEDESGRNSGAEVTLSGPATLRVEPSGGWRAGGTYTLRIGPDFADRAGNAWGETLELPFTVSSSTVGDTLAFAEVRDAARLGSWLFVAAGPDGLQVIDSSDPADLRPVVVDSTGQSIGWAFPYDDPVRAVAVDPHGRVLVVGGGVASPGQLKIFDPLALDVAAVAANPSDSSIRYAAFRGSTVLSDQLGGGAGTSLPEGQPRRVTVLSDDELDRWVLDVDAPPAGVTATDLGDGTWTLTGGGGVAGQPVTVVNLDRGGMRRVDADGAGAWTLTVPAGAGEPLELRRNRKTLAYVATLGVGIEVVDVSAFYGEAPEDPQNPDLESDVLGIYSGRADPDLSLCGRAVSGIGSALIDLGTLFDPADPHPLTLVGLVGFRGLALFESDPADVGDVSFFNEACLELGGSALVSGLVVVEDWRFEDAEASAPPRDYLAVTHRREGLLIFDVTDRDNLRLVSWIRLPGEAGALALDRQRGRLWVSGLGGGLYGVDFAAAPSLELLDADEDGLDDRVVETLALEGNTNAPTLLVPELGLAFAGGLDRGLTSVQVASPRMAAVDLESRPVDRLAPLGVPTPENGAPAAFRILARLPGGVGPQVDLEVVALGPGGVLIDGAGDLTGLPQPQLPTVTLHRLADQPWEEGYQVYRSEPVVAVADLRAAADYVLTADEGEICSRCDRTAEGIPAGAIEILSGHSIAVRFPLAARQALSGIYPSSSLDAAELELPSIPWDTSPSVDQEPSRNASYGGGEVAPGLLLASGELTRDAIDLAVAGRGLDVAFGRTYRSRSVGSGPLGPGWDLGYRVRLRELPTGDVELRDGRGRGETFVRNDEGGYTSPTGVFSELSQTGSGWTLLDPRRNLSRFDRWGQRVSIADAVKESDTTGNELTFGYDLAGRLVTVTDDLDRQYRLAYDQSTGRLISITDFTDRTVTYEYDSENRLETVTSPSVTVGETTFPSGLTTTYAYESPTGDLATSLATRDNLQSFTDPTNTTTLAVIYTDADGDGRADEVTGQSWGGDPLSIAYDLGSRTATVTDRRGETWVTKHDEAGHATQRTDPSGATWQTTYDEEGLVTEERSPLGRIVATTYSAPTGPSPGDRRSRGDALTVAVTADARGPNGSSGTQTTQFEYDSRTHLPVRITDPRGIVTEIARAPSGRPERITRAVGLPEQAVTQLTWDDFGRLTRQTDPAGRVTSMVYGTDGYLARETVDPAGLALTTRYEPDALGRTLAVTDPRGVRHERDVNELGWTVAETAAASGALDGSQAGALGYRTAYRHDAVGRVTERRDPVGDGSTFASTTFSWGDLGEVLSATHTLQPSGQTVTESWEYDAGRQLIRHTDPVGTATQWLRDARGLPTSVTVGAGTAVAATETSTFNDEGAQISRIDARGKVWTTEYDGYGRLAASVNPLGHRSETTYRDGHLLEEQRRLDAGGILVSRSGADWDALGRVAARKAWLWEGSAVASAREIATSYGYDPAGNVLTVTDPRGQTTAAQWDGASRLASVADPVGNATAYSRDAAGNVVQSTMTEQSPTGAATVTTTAAYDALGRPTAMADAFGNTTATVWDAQSQPILTSDPEGALTSRAYDSLGRQLTETKPEGIAVHRSYDPVGRLIQYKDALDQATTYGYDARGRQICVTYPDSTQEIYAHDPAGHVTQVTQATGSVITLSYDDAGRPLSRSTAAATDVFGAVPESYTHDALNRLTTATSGGITVSRTFDSLSRLQAETVAGQTVTYGWDDAGARTSIGYPSGHTVTTTVDDLGRPTALTSAAGNLVTYSYRGQSRIAGKSLAAGAIRGSSTFDTAGRRLESIYSGLGGATVFGERQSWSPRSLTTARTRLDDPTQSRAFGYDPAGRLTTAAQIPDPASAFANNTVANLGAVEQGTAFTYDPAQNLLARTEVDQSIQDSIPMPTDLSGRNRPASVDGAPLTYDANGNLTAREDQRLYFDERNRLTRVTDTGGTEIARYEYDVFNRRVRKMLPNTTEQTVYAGWQALETYQGGQLHQRRTWGLGIDEAVRLETDFTGDGVPETIHLPLYDSTGNLVTVTSATGKPIERYSYSPFGERKVFVDSTPPEVEQVRVVGDEIWIELSEAVSEGPLIAAATAGTLKLVDTATSTPMTLTVSQPVATGRQARKRIVLVPDAVPATGEEVRLTLPASPLMDSFLNQPVAAYEKVFNWPAADAVIEDTTAPAIQHVLVRAGKLEIQLTEQPDLAAATSAIQIDGAATTWELSADGYTLTMTDALAAGSHTLTVGTGALELAGNGLAQNFSATIDPLTASATGFVFQEPDPRAVTTTTTRNPFGFQGLPIDEETGLFYVRNRYFDPEMGRFISSDPMGYVDGPNGYQFGLNSPVDLRDPLGLCVLGLPCPDFIEDSESAVVIFVVDTTNDVAEFGVGIGDVASKGEATRVREGLSTFLNTKGTFRERFAAGIYVGDQAANVVRSFGFSEADDPVEHAKEMALNSLGHAQFREGSLQLTEGYYEGDWQRIVSGGVRLWGGAGQVILAVVGARATSQGLWKIPGGAARFVDSGGRIIDRASIRTTVSTQRQGRHVLGAREYGGGSYFRSIDDAQRVLDDFHSGAAEILGSKGNDIVVRAPSVTGFNHNPRAGFPHQPTNVFFIKGSSSPSIVPYNPIWSP